MEHRPLVLTGLQLPVTVVGVFDGLGGYRIAMRVVRRLRARAWPAVTNAVRELGQPESQTRYHLTQIVKATIAAILAWYLVVGVIGGKTAWLAPVTAVLMVHATVYQSIVEGIKRVIAVAAGAAAAAAAGSLIGLNGFGLLLVVPLSLLAARLRWIGAQGEYIAITAVLLLTFGVSTNENFLFSYLRDTAVGASTGALVNLLLFPPAYQRSVRAAVSEQATDTARVLRDLAEGARTGWRGEDADEWRHRARKLEGGAEAAQTALRWSQEGMRWNPWPRRNGMEPPRNYQPAVDTLWHIAIEMRALTRSMRDATVPPAGDEDPPEDPLTAAPPLYDDLAPLLESVAEVVDTFGDDPTLRDGGLSAPVAEKLAHAETRYREMSRQLPQAGITEPVPFEATGSILQDVRRILGYLRDIGSRREP